MALLKKNPKPDVMPPDLQDAEARLQQSGLASTAAPRKKSASPALLGGGAFLLVALALGAWHFMGASSGGTAETEGAGSVAPSRPSSSLSGSDLDSIAKGTPQAPAPAASPASPVASSVAAAPVASGAPAISGGAPRAGATPGKSVARLQRAALNRPGRVGLVPADRPAGALPFPPSAPGQLGRSVPVQGAPTPIQPPDGMAGTPGRRGGSNAVVISPSVVQNAPDQLKVLWNQGAAAKRRGDKRGARRAWGLILQLSPGHPGIQQAIDKLG